MCINVLDDAQYLAGKTTAVFFLVIYLVPLAVMLGLLQISRWYEGKFPTPPPKRKSKRPQKSRK